MKNTLLAFFAFCAIQLNAANITFSVTNNSGPSSNTITVFPVQSYPNSDGSYQGVGLPLFVYMTNGFGSLSLLPGNYLATNSDLCSQYVGPGQVGTPYGVVFAVPNTGGTYPFGLLALPSSAGNYNVFNYSGATLTNGTTSAGVSNALGFIPLSPAQVTNVFLASNTNQYLAGTNVTLTTNGNAITIQVPNQGFLTNGLVGPGITNGLATIAFVQSVTNGNTFITTSNSSAFTTPTQATNISLAAAFAQGMSDTNFTLSVSNSLLATNALFLNASSNALVVQGGLSNALQAANLLLTSNALWSAKQPSSTSLSNLSVTTAFTNQIQAGANITFTTNFGSSPLYTITISGNSQTNLTNGLAVWSVQVPSSFLGTNALPALTNGFITSAALSGLLSSATAATTYYPTSNPSGFVTSSSTNGLSAYVALTYYPTSNPSFFITASSLASYVTSNQMASSIQSSNALLATLAQVSATNLAASMGVTNYVGSVTGTVTVYIQGYVLAATNSVQTNLYAYALGVSNYVTSATNYLKTNTIPYMLTNAPIFEDLAGDSITGGLFTSSVGDTFGHGNFSIAGGQITGSDVGLMFADYYTDHYGTIPVSTNIALESSLATYLPITNGSAHNLSVADYLLFGLDTNMIVSTACIGVFGGGAGNGGYYQTPYNLNIWTNYLNPGYSITFFSGNYYLSSNGVTIYYNTTAQGQWFNISGPAPAPQSAYTFKFYCNGVQFEGYFYSTNITAQIAAAVAGITNAGSGGGTNIFVLGGYGISNSISATGNTNTIFINTNVTATVAWVLSVITAPTNGISATTGSNIVANYGSILYYPLTTNPSNYVTQIALNGSNYTTLNFVTNLVAVTSNALVQLTGVTPTIVTNMILANAPGVAQSTLVGGEMIGTVTNMSFNSAGTNAIVSIANTLAQIMATNAIGNLNGYGTNVNLFGISTFNTNLNISQTQANNPGSVLVSGAGWSAANGLYVVGGVNSCGYSSFNGGSVTALTKANNPNWTMACFTSFWVIFTNFIPNNTFCWSNSYSVAYICTNITSYTYYGQVGNSFNNFGSYHSSLLGPFPTFTFYPPLSELDSVITASNSVIDIIATGGVDINTNYPNGNALEVNGNVDSSVGFSVNGQPIGYYDGVQTISGIYSSLTPTYFVASFQGATNSFNGNYGLWTYPLPITGTNIYLNANAEKFGIITNWVADPRIPAIIETNGYYVFFNVTLNRYYTNGSLYGYYAAYGSTLPTNSLFITNATGLYNLTNSYGTLPIASLPGSVVTTNNYVSTNTAITIYNDTLARTYCNTNHVSDLEAQGFLTTAWNDQYALGVASNVVSAECFDSRFNPTNYDLLLNPMTVPLGANYGVRAGANANGAIMWGTNVWIINIPTLTNFCLTFWYWQSPSNLDNGKTSEGAQAQPFVALYNTNNWSGAAAGADTYNAAIQTWASSLGTNWGTIGGPPNIQTNRTWPMMNGQYDPRISRGTPHVMTISGNTNGLISRWTDSKQDNYVNAGNTNVNAFGQNGPYNQLWIGGAGTNFFYSMAPVYTPTNAFCTFGGFILYNISAEANPAVNVAGYRFATDLMRYHSAIDFGGTSMINYCSPAFQTSVGNGIPCTNSLGYLYSQANPDVLTLVDASPGSTMASFTSMGNRGTNTWNSGALTNLNASRYPTRIFETSGPYNDAIANASLANIGTYWNSFINPISSIGIPVYLIDLHWDYAIPANTNLYWRNVVVPYIETNFPIAGVIREADYVGTNVSAAFSADNPPVHEDAYNIFAHNFTIGFANLCAFKPWPYPNWSATWMNYNSSMGPVDAGIQGMQQLAFQVADTNGAQRTTFDGSALTNIQPFLIQTNFIINQRYTNTYGCTITVSANVVLTTAAVVGESSLALMAVSSPLVGGWTNTFGVQTTGGSLAVSYTNVLSNYIPTNSPYWFTNTSSGLGDTVSVLGGQIKYP